MNTSRKPQPAFAVQTAIAFASTVLGGVTFHRSATGPALFLLNIGKKRQRQEHGKWAVEKAAENIMNCPTDWSIQLHQQRRRAVCLHDQPAHLTVIDEFGKALENASVKNNAATAPC